MPEKQSFNTKRCARCHATKNTAEFCLSTARKDGLNPYCRPCQSEKTRAAYAIKRSLLPEKIEIPEQHKKCSHCQLVQGRERFNKNRSTKDGLHHACMDCKKKLRKPKPRKPKKPKIPYEDLNPGGIKFCRKCQCYKNVSAFYVDNRMKDLLNRLCKVCQNVYTKASGAKVPRSVRRIYEQNSAKKDPVKYKAGKRKSYNKRFKSDPKFRARHFVRNRTKAVLKKYLATGKAPKGQKFSKSLGTDIKTFVLYLESLFQLGMNWDNYGYSGWHVDHIYPLSQALKDGPEAFEKACHYTNLQPLWAKDNLSKGAKLDWQPLP